MRKTACMGTCFVHAAGFASTVADASKLQSYQEDKSKRFDVIRKIFPAFFWLKPNKNFKNCKKLRATVAPRRPRERNFPTHARPVTP